MQIRLKSNLLKRLNPAPQAAWLDSDYSERTAGGIGDEQDWSLYLDYNFGFDITDEEIDSAVRNLGLKIDQVAQEECEFNSVDFSTEEGDTCLNSDEAARTEVQVQVVASRAVITALKAGRVPIREAIQALLD